MRPRIAISCGVYGEDRRVRASVTYAESIWAAGGMPFYVPAVFEDEDWIDTVFDMADGVLFTGGGDVEPSLYGAVPSAPLHDVVAQRDEIEIAVMREAADRRLPVLGICRGCQVLNVSFGGTLYQDVPSQRPSDVSHPEPTEPRPEDEIVHQVRLAAGSRLADAYKSQGVATNSMHHQAVDKVGDDLVPVAFAPDDLVEGVEAREGWIVGVQWHPERMFHRHPEHLGLFRAFVEAARTSAPEQASGALTGAIGGSA